MLIRQTNSESSAQLWEGHPFAVKPFSIRVVRTALPPLAERSGRCPGQPLQGRTPGGCSWAWRGRQGRCGWLPGFLLCFALNYIQAQPSVTSAFRVQKPNCGFTHRNTTGVITKRGREQASRVRAQFVFLRRGSYCKPRAQGRGWNLCAWEP